LPILIDELDDPDRRAADVVLRVAVMVVDEAGLGSVRGMS